MNRNICLSVALALGVAAPALAQTAPAQGNVIVGAIVYGSDGGAIGTIGSMQDDVVVLEVGKRVIPIPRSLLIAGENGPTIDITREAFVSQFDEQTAQYEKKLNVAIVNGASIQTADGKRLGVINEASADNVVVKLPEGFLKLPRQILALDQQGQLIARATMAQIREAMTPSPEKG